MGETLADDSRHFGPGRYPRRERKPLLKGHSNDSDEDGYEEVMFEKQKLMTTHAYNMEELVSSTKFSYPGVVPVLHDIKEFNLEELRQNGFSTPLLFKIPPAQLGMRVPEANSFTVDSVLQLVGGQRKIEVVEVKTQMGKSMKLKEFVEYYKSSGAKRAERGLLNVLSLEFTLTSLEREVNSPAFVREIDWISNVWPEQLKERQRLWLEKEPDTNYSTYPKVQRYCLMSVRDCYTDFHVDFGGTSVWYHILKGKKIFWVIEPTDENMLLYENWILGGNNSKSFFGYVVNQCVRIELCAGDTFFIPSGWIHCVYTPEDSLVFGGNFLHSYSIPMMLKVLKSEDKMRVQPKYRFPHFKPTLFFVIAKVVWQATGRNYVGPIRPEIQWKAGSNSPNREPTPPVFGSLPPLPAQTATFDQAYHQSPMFHKHGMEESDEEEENDIPFTYEIPAPHHPAAIHAIEKDDTMLDTQSNGTCCYDDIPKGLDDSFDLSPTQLVYSEVDKEPFTPPNTYNEEFVKMISDIQLDGYEELFDFASSLIKTKAPEIAEGITRPRHLLQDFGRLILHLNQGRNRRISKTFVLRPKIRSEKKCFSHCIYRQRAYTEAKVQLTVAVSAASPRENSREEREEEAEEETIQAIVCQPMAQEIVEEWNGGDAHSPSGTQPFLRCSASNEEEIRSKKPLVFKHAKRKGIRQGKASIKSTTAVASNGHEYAPLDGVVKLGQGQQSASGRRMMSIHSATARKILEEKRKLKSAEHRKEPSYLAESQPIEPLPQQLPQFAAPSRSFLINSQCNTDDDDEMEFKSPLRSRTTFQLKPRLPRPVNPRNGAEPELINLCETPSPSASEPVELDTSGVGDNVSSERETRNPEVVGSSFSSSGPSYTPEKNASDLINDETSKSQHSLSEQDEEEMDSESQTPTFTPPMLPHCVSLPQPQNFLSNLPGTSWQSNWRGRAYGEHIRGDWMRGGARTWRGHGAGHIGHRGSHLRRPPDLYRPHGMKWGSVPANYTRSVPPPHPYMLSAPPYPHPPPTFPLPYPPPTVPRHNLPHLYHYRQEFSLPPPPICVPHLKPQPYYNASVGLHPGTELSPYMGQADLRFFPQETHYVGYFPAPPPPPSSGSSGEQSAECDIGEIFHERKGDMKVGGGIPPPPRDAHSDEEQLALRSMVNEQMDATTSVVVKGETDNTKVISKSTQSEVSAISDQTAVENMKVG